MTTFDNSLLPFLPTYALPAPQVEANVYSHKKADSFSTRPSHRRFDALKDLLAYPVILLANTICYLVKAIFSLITSLFTSSKPPQQVTKLRAKNAGNKSELHQARGRSLPTECVHEFIVAQITFKEKTKNISPSLGTKYLANFSSTGKYVQEITYINSHLRDDKIGIRPSAVRKEHVAQAMPINLRGQILNAGGEEIGSLFRSGAFAVHDPYYPTETEYENYQKDEILKKLNKRWGEAVTPQMVEERIQQRRQLCLSQALPKVMASVEKMAKEGIPPQGFLHVEQSLLSDAYPSDKEMIKDMARAMETIRTKAHVTFTAKEQSVTVGTDDEIVINLQIEKASLHSDTKYGVCALFFTQGVNEMQTIGDLLSNGERLQDEINDKGLKELKEYAKRSGKATPELDAHFAATHPRAAKDVAGIQCMTATVEELGGQLGIVCKSGKDRTAMVVDDYLARCAITKGNLPQTSYREMRDKLDGGRSLEITEECTGTKGYAFNAFQRPLLPPELTPRADLCGNAQS